MALHRIAGALLPALLVSLTARAQAPEPAAPPPTAAPAPDAAPPAQAPAPAPATPPPPQYYTEPAAPPTTQPEAQPPPETAPPRPPGVQIYEPPPPGYGYPTVYEPPPPPQPKHAAPKYSLWLGGRVGWFIPFGNAWGTCTVIDAFGDCIAADTVGWDQYASSGGLFELNAGARISRNYNLFVLWEHARLGAGDAFPDDQQGGDTNTDFYALGLRVSSDPDRVGLLTELALGYRRFHAVFEDGSELQLTDAPFEVRIGLGADIRLSPLASLSPLLTVGFGSFGEVEAAGGAGSLAQRAQPADVRTTHGWVTLQLGGHFDLLGSNR